MATPLAPGESLRVVIGSYFTVPKQVGENVVYYVVNSAGGMTLEDFAANMNGRIKNQYAAWMAPSAQYSGLSVQRVAGGPRTTPYYLLSPLTGTATGTRTQASQVAGLIRYRSVAIPAPTLVPALHGRSFVPFPSDAWLSTTNNDLNASGAAALDAIASKLGPNVGFAGGAAFSQAIYSRTYAAYPLVANYEIVYSFATQKSRGAFGRLNHPFGE